MNTEEINSIVNDQLPQSKPVRRPRVSGKLTRKQKAFADALLSDPKKTQRDAYRESYDAQNMKVGTIDVEAYKTINRPSVKSYLANYNAMVENTLLNTIQEWGNSPKERQRELAVNASMYVHDKIHGKATQRVQQETRSFKFTMDLTGESETTDPKALQGPSKEEVEYKPISNE